ncbi:MAG TPA: trypsin-like peptidase domain-containing protein [Roseiflexaceae bacterium]|nr:trypsin-like peptidase domain-containing protein [Roseiflexaceae bacterium]
MKTHSHINVPKPFARTLALGATLLALSACSQFSSDGLLQPVTTAPAASSSNTSVSGQTAPQTAPTTMPATAQPALAAGTGASLADFSTEIRAVAQEAKPAVVQITNEQVQLDQYNQAYNVPAGVGSGIIYDDQGHILTNDHVIEGAQQLSVSLPNGTTLPATLVGADPQTDLAVVQVHGQNLPIAQLGDSNALQVGDWVVAIGNALALPGGPTVSAGVVSALDRSVQEPGDGTTSAAGPYLFDVIQTDAPINPGNSGGPLVNLQGQVIGINTMVAGQAEPGVQAQGIGFAISIATAKPIADQLVASGKVVHPYLGIGSIPLTPVIAQQLGVSAKTGTVVVTVGRGSPAAQAGLQRGDVITAMDGTALMNDSDFAKIINAHKPGDVLTLTIARADKTITAKATLVERPTQ